MKVESRTLRAEFGPDTRFVVKPAPPAPFRATEENRFEALRRGLVAARLDELWETDLTPVVRRAANEAAALAWVTRYPLLVFPALFEEKLAAAVAVAERQERIRVRTRELLAV